MSTKNYPIVELDPVRVFRIFHENGENLDYIDIFLQDVSSPDSIVCIMKNGEFLPFDEWDDFELKLRLHLHNPN